MKNLAKYYVINVPNYDFMRKIGTLKVIWHNNTVNSSCNVKILNKFRETVSIISVIAEAALGQVDTCKVVKIFKSRF